MNIKQSLDGEGCYRFFNKKQNAKLSLFDINHKKISNFSMIDVFLTVLWCLFICDKIEKSNLPRR